MGEDEVSTVRTLESYRAVMSDLIEQFRGRVVDFPGDNLLASICLTPILSTNLFLFTKMWHDTLILNLFKEKRNEKN